MQNLGVAAGAAIRYRKDFDGLRRVAVLAVVAYHVGWHFLPSGRRRRRIFRAVRISDFSRIPLLSNVAALAATANKARRVIASKRISARWKSIVLLHYSVDIMNRALTARAMLIGAAALVIVPAVLLDALFGPQPSALDSFVSPSAVAGMTLSSAVYLTLRKRRGRL
jgi:hypothetical protein